MSLTTLTFGNCAAEVAEKVGKGKIQVIKTDYFYGSDGVCVIGRLIEGVVSKSMQISGKEDCKVITVESKYGDGLCTKTGAQVLLMIDGISKEDYSAGQEIAFEKNDVALISRPKGRLIIA